MDEPHALWIPSPNYFPARDGHTPRWLIIHGTGGFTSAEEVGHYFQVSQSATHYTVGRDGSIVQSVREHDGAWANGSISGPPGLAGDGIHHDYWWTREINPNNVTISIEHVKPHKDNSDLLTEIQTHTSFRLIQHICDRHNIAKRRADEYGGITGHYSMEPVERSYCPGPYPWDELFAFLQ